MMGGIKAQHDCIKVLSETDFTEDLKAISARTLYMATTIRSYRSRIRRCFP